MPNTEIELNPIEFITIGTVGPKGRRQFHLQASDGSQLITLLLEKEQARHLSEAVTDMLNELAEKENTSPPSVNLPEWNMDLRDPIEPQFRIGRMGLGYDERANLIILVAQELLIPEEDEDSLNLGGISPSIVRFWGTDEQYQALSEHTTGIVNQGRADPSQNGHVIYYWT